MRASVDYLMTRKSGLECRQGPLMSPLVGPLSQFSSIEEVADKLEVVGELLATPGGTLERTIGSVVPVGRRLAGEAGIAVVEEVMRLLAHRIQQVLRAGNVLHLLKVLRLYARSGAGSRSIDAYDRIHLAERAVLKYARWAAPQTDPLVSLGPVTSADLYAAGTALVFGDTFFVMLGWRRRLAKGQVLRVQSLSPINYCPDTVDDMTIDELIRRFDARNDPSALDYLGQLDPAPRPSPELPIISGGLDDRFAYFDTDPLGLASPQIRNRSTGEPYGVGFLGGLAAFLAGTAHLADSLRTQYGVCTLDLLVVLAELSRRLDSEAGWGAPINLCLREYGLASGRWPTSQEWELAAAAHAGSVEPFTSPISGGSLEAAAELLTVSPNHVDLAGSHSAGPILRFGRQFIYDATAVAPGLCKVLLDVRASDYAQERTARRLERQTHDLLSRFGSQPWRSGAPVKIGRRQITDMDASVVVGQTLVAVDCYSSPLTSSLELGEHRRTRNRAAELMNKLIRWDVRMKELAETHSRTNIDLSTVGVRKVLPVVVSAMPEWVPTISSEFWLTDTQPRICSARELARYLARRDVERAPNVLAVRGAESSPSQ